MEEIINKLASKLEKSQVKAKGFKQMKVEFDQLKEAFLKSESVRKK
jgi:hypothetical protein